ncbi:hypothetical protein Tco_0940457 [Tanacetum coccineum]|uniref:Uncharacterized protein n=1 Tax=Tanacetum coccineum TaxID=301880 RepID=A0ABQ5DQD0_9ASTR
MTAMVAMSRRRWWRCDGSNGFAVLWGEDDGVTDKMIGLVLLELGYCVAGSLMVKVIRILAGYHEFMFAAMAGVGIVGIGVLRCWIIEGESYLYLGGASRVRGGSVMVNIAGKKDSVALLSTDVTSDCGPSLVNLAGLIDLQPCGLVQFFPLECMCKNVFAFLKNSNVIELACTFDLCFFDATASFVAIVHVGNNMRFSLLSLLRSNAQIVLIYEKSLHSLYSMSSHTDLGIVKHYVSVNYTPSTEVLDIGPIKPEVLPVRHSLFIDKNCS